MKVLVTGATGFLGTMVASILEAEGHQVVRMSRSAGGDILDGQSVTRAAVGCECAVHCAGRVSRDPKDAEDLYRIHVDGTKRVLDACAAASVRRVVVVSTSGTVAVREDASEAVTEDAATPLAIISRWPYYRTKLFAEQAAMSRNRAGFEVISVNPSWMLGPGDERGSSVADIRAFLDGRILATPAGGLSFVDVRDAAHATCAALEYGRPGERYLLGACNLTFREFLGRLSRVSGVRAPTLPLPSSRSLVRLGASWMDQIATRFGGSLGLDPVAADMAQHFWYFDSSKATRELEFRPRDPNVTLHDTVTDLRARGVVWPLDDARRSAS